MRGGFESIGCFHLINYGVFLETSLDSSCHKTIFFLLDSKSEEFQRLLFTGPNMLFIFHSNFIAYVKENFC